MKAGFTLIELLVSISIFVIITAVAVWNNNAFNSSILLTDLGYEVALSVRQSQVYGITVKAPSSCVGGPCSFTSGYGIDFNMTSPTSYILFEDKGPRPDHIYESANGEQLQNYVIGRGYSIKQICVAGASVSTLDVSFVRPEPEAWISANGGAAVSNAEADIYIQDPGRVAQREIIIEPTGQISVVNNSSHC
jgi:prepilin-type N-terminal cleavage/methylation domain-containing protein